ncbi:unnamed protein product [Clonostachys byssicola]|uniref:Arrestin-like N-terminal domain-containing protein n=1 Tax=Clonostachys byssicola TaxID=160290 RepID=A0A9N9Y3I5_9HYPO|nr:unnamed protein product [Clonostachys byssicola]
MTPTRYKSLPALGIELEGQRTAFYPGDAIIGTVHRSAPIVCTEATIDIAFHGRTKSRMEMVNSPCDGTYRGRFTLLHQTQSVFAGPMHIPGGSPKQKEWPFAIQIPQNIDARLFHRQYDAKKSFIPTDPACVGNQPLPASFYGRERVGESRRSRNDGRCQTRQLNKRDAPFFYDGYGDKEGFIEYYIEATLRYQRRGSWHEVTATMPIQILAFNPNPPVVDFHMQRTSRLGLVCTQRLVPGMENAELSKIEKMKKLFGARSVPAFFFRLNVDLPSVIQLGRDPIPVLMRFVPDWPNTSEIIRNVPQKATLVAFKVKLESWCGIRCDGRVRAHDTNWREKLYLQSEANAGRRVAVGIPCSDKTSPTDVGRALNIRIGGYVGTHSVFHDFTMFNVKLSHQFSWTAKVEIAGEECTLHGTQPVKVLPQPSDRRPRGLAQSQSATAHRAESWTAPPADMEPLPTFAEVERVDKEQSIAHAQTMRKGAVTSAKSG